MDAELLFYSDLRWGTHLPEPAERLTRFAQRGYRVHYVEQLGIRNPHLRHVLRMARAAVGRPAGDAPPPFHVVSPRLVAPRRAPVVDAVNKRWLRRQLVGAVEDPANTILWIRYPTPELVPLVEQAPWRLVIYEAMDAHDIAPGLPARLRRRLIAAERRILARAALVFVSSEPVRARLAAVHGNVVRAPAAAVDLDAFARAAPTSLGQPPVACYTGSFDPRLDAKLTIAVAELLPRWTFVFAGPMTNPAARRLLELPNVVWLDTVPLADVPGVIAGADVCLMPYVADRFGDTLFPIKLVEYLAAGKPVVSTPIEAAREFGDVVALAGDAAAFAAAVQAAPGADSEAARERRRQRVAHFSWEGRIDQMDDAIHAAAGLSPAVA
jgi:glycosyltransferase involved in cell wall biosynthesis